MKKLIILVLLAVVCASCTKDNISYDALFITSSSGAFNGEEPAEILPSFAQVILDDMSSEYFSLKVYYYWGNETNGIVISIPHLKRNGEQNDFTFSEDNIEATCILSFARKGLQEIRLSASGYYKRTAKRTSFHLIISPSNNRICPWLEINEVSTTKVKLEAGEATDIGGVGLPRIILVNQLSIPVTFEWEDCGISQRVIKANESKSFMLDYDVDYLELPHVKPFIKKPIFTIDGQKYEVDLFADWEYSKSYYEKYSFTAGQAYLRARYEYTFNITQELYEELLTTLNH